MAGKTAKSTPKRPPLKPGPDGVVRLSGGNPQIAKGDGDGPVQAFIAAMPGWQSEIGRQMDAIIVEVVPDVFKSVKWNTPFYGTEPKSWFVSFHCMTKYIKVAFPDGTSLEPVPPGTSKQANVRYLDVREGAFDAEQFADWVRQASRLPGERFGS
ncbi:DUF1801 domain-containing protein [Pelagibacterium luteolum]|uniref:YdhG-like domain-containing protein n=1 Tax=Pelagibacterium luteolum TaxID=440168 RepID=A0A1G7TL24_9HYPH|nr:DUF1801 domain-containing protein [Pelagibacterium luteolum]SDG35714.1 hypothetical protein SAMN04487974_102182 [Pelagibacterium luteolum]